MNNRIDNVMKATYLLRKSLEEGNRHFVYTEDVGREYVKVFNYVNSDIKLMEFAKDSFGMTSDCYILYAIGHLGMAERNTVLLFLSAIAHKNPALNIANLDRGRLIDRLRVLNSMGLIFKHRYEVAEPAVEGGGNDTVALYSLTEDAFNLVKQRLQKRLIINSAIQMKPIKELIGWACAGFVGAYIAVNAVGFVEYLDRVLRTKQIGTVYFPCEMKIQKDGCLYYVAVFNAYMGMDASYQTKSDYADMCALKVNTIRNYLNCRTQKGKAVAVIAVSDNADLNEIAGCIHKSGVMEEFYDRIYYTGEGIIKSEVLEGLNVSAGERFLRMQEDAESEKGYSILQCMVPFL